MADLTNIRLGACEVTYGGTDLGLTQEGCVLTLNTHWLRQSFDEWGETLVDAWTTGFEMKVVVTLSESQKTEVMEAAVPLLTTSSSGYSFGKKPGTRASTYQATVTFHPHRLDASDTSEDVVITNAVVLEPSERPYKVDGIAVYPVTFEGLMDTTNDILGTIGVATDTTAPTVSSISPADGSTSIDITESLTVTLSENMHEASLIDGYHVVLTDKTTGATASDCPALTLTYNSSTFELTVNPDSSLTASTEYVLTIGTGVKDLAGNHLASTWASSFTTAA